MLMFPEAVCSVDVKKAISIMNFAGYRAESKPLFSKLGLLKFEDTYKFETAKFMHITPTLCDLIQKTNVRHSYNKTRQATQNQFSLPLVTTECRKKFITFNGIKILNEIPLEIRSMSRKNKFSKVTYKNCNSVLIATLCKSRIFSQALNYIVNINLTPSNANHFGN